MSDDTTEQTQNADQVEGEAQPSRIAGGCVLLAIAAVGVLVLKAVVVAAPYVAYFVTGVLVTLGVQKARARWGKDLKAHADRDEGEEEQLPGVGEALRRLVGDDNGVLLTHLRDHLGLPDTKAVKRLLDADSIPWKGVRTSHGNGPGVHKNDIPPAPSPYAADSHGEGCCCRSGDNANTNNSPEEEPEEGLHVEAIGQAGTLVHDPTEASRHHDLTH